MCAWTAGRSRREKADLARRSLPRSEFRTATRLLEAAWSQKRSEQPRAPQLPNKGPQRVPRQYIDVRRGTSEDTGASPRQTLIRAKLVLSKAAFAPMRSGRAAVFESRG